MILCLLSTFAYSLSDYILVDKTAIRAPTENYDAQVIVVKFKDEGAFRLRGGRISPQNYGQATPLLPRAWSQWIRDVDAVNQIVKDYDFVLVPTMSDPDDLMRELEIDEKQEFRRQNTGKYLADLNNYFSLVSRELTDTDSLWPIVEQINQLESVEIAYVEAPSTGATNIASPNTNPLPPSASSLGAQFYLSNTNNGIHAIDGWNWKGGTGANVKVVAVDDNINPDHIDLVHKSWFGRWWSNVSNSTVSNHGTAVAGILFAGNNNFGITGIVHDVNEWGFVSARRCIYAICWLDPAFGVADAAAWLSAGDVISMSIQYPGPNGGVNAQVPAEWSSAVFSATQAAVADGIVVVALAGNFGLNLDSPIYNGAFDFNVRDSGAIIVGGSRWDETQGVHPGSNYGSRVTSHAWYEQVATLGYNPVGGNFDLAFRGDFGGTSAATPIVAGAAASIQSIRKGMGMPPLGPTLMRALLFLGGTPQTYETSKNIGSMPNIHNVALLLQQGILACTLGTESYTIVGGVPTYSFPSIQIKNISGTALNGWTAYVDIQIPGIIPTVLSSNVTAEVRNDVIVLSSANSLAPGQTVTVSLAVQYNVAVTLPFTTCY
jgi:hypothetical protein